MRICIPVQVKQQGGAHHFLAAWRGYLGGQGIEAVADLLARYDVLFLNSWLTQPAQVHIGMARNPRALVVQRVDGAAQDYGRRRDADDRQAAVNRLADLTIFQSAYSRHATRVKFPIIAQDGPIILNPVDLDRFTPEGTRQDLPGQKRLVYVSWSANRLKGWPELYTVAAQHPEVDFFLAGNFPDLPVLPNLHLMGILDRDALPILLRSCDALLTFSQNEACPNHVLEGLASGLPILYLASGATPELVGDAGMPVTVQTFGAALERLWASRDQYARRARQRACQNFAPELVLRQYLEAIQEAFHQPRRIGVVRRWFLAGQHPRLWLAMIRSRLS